MDKDYIRKLILETIRLRDIQSEQALLSQKQEFEKMIDKRHGEKDCNDENCNDCFYRKELKSKLKEMK